MGSANVQILLWMLPVALIIHVTEEFGFPGGFARWIARHNPQRVKSARYYVLVNAAAILASVSIASLARGAVGYWLYLYSTALMAGNAVSHLRAAFRNHEYCPGSVSGSALLIPLFLFSSWFLLANRFVSLPLAIFGAALGLTAGLILLPVDARSRYSVPPA